MPLSFMQDVMGGRSEDAASSALKYQKRYGRKVYKATMPSLESFYAPSIRNAYGIIGEMGGVSPEIASTYDRTRSDLAAMMSRQGLSGTGTEARVMKDVGKEQAVTSAADRMQRALQQQQAYSALADLVTKAPLNAVSALGGAAAGNMQMAGMQGQAAGAMGQGIGDLASLAALLLL